jgi:flagellar hook-basal body protein
MDVIGNNISNVNTVGFKGRRVTFEESFNQLMKGASRTESKAGGTNPMQVGLGVSTGSVDVMTGQGNLQNTSRIFFFFFEGNAFFGLSDVNGTYYTRNGAFQLDSEGYIMLPTNGMVLQGKMADSFGNFPAGTAIGNVQIPMNQQAPAKETTEVTIARNLNSESDAKGTVTYSQRMLHPADQARLELTNSYNDPGRETTNLNSLYNSKGQPLNMKENDILTISWFDQASVTPGTQATGELTIKISEEVGTPTINGAPTTAWTIDDFAAAIQFAINHNRNGDAFVPPTAHEVKINDDGSFSIIHEGGTSTSQIFNLQVKSSNPLSNSYVNKAFHFGSHIGPQIGNYPSNMEGKSDTLLRPAEQFDYIEDLRDQNGNRMYPGLDNGDPIDVFGSIGKTSIENGKSDPLTFYSANAWDTSGAHLTPPIPDQRVSITDPNTLTEIDQYNKLWEEINKFAAKKNPPYAAGTNFADKLHDYIQSYGGTMPGPNTIAHLIDGNTVPISVQGITSLQANYFIDKDGKIEKILLDSSTFPTSIAGVPTLRNVTLLDDLISKIRNDFKLPQEYIDRDGNHLLSVGMNPVGTDDGIPPGSIVVRGSKGKDFAINQLSIRGVNSNSDNVAPTFFNSSMGFTEKRKAEDVGVFDSVISVYDESGAEHVMTITFVHTGRAGEWEWKATFAGKEDIVPGSGSGKVTFGQDGTISSWVFDNGGSQLQVDPHNGSNMMNISLNVGGPGDFRGITQFASATTVNCTAQDGYTTGNLIEVSIDEFGLIEGAFSNGTTRKIAQIMMVDFANPGGLMDMSDSVYTTSANSGDPIWGLPMTQSSSKLKPGALEISNVDLSNEFTNMITTQRGYQANSRVITVSDTMLEELVNLKR